MQSAGSEKLPFQIELAAVEREIKRFATGRRLPLRFSDPLEPTYHVESCARRRRQIARGGLGALIVYDMFVVGDFLLWPDHVWQAIAVRFGLVTPIVLLALYVLRDDTRIAVHEGAAAVLCTLAFGSVLFLHAGSDTSAALQAEPGALLVLLAMNTLLRLDFLVALLSSSVCLLGFFCFLMTVPNLTVLQQWNVGGRVFWFAVISLAANYALCRERRLSWVSQMRGRLQQDILSNSNKHLLNLSFTDPLTGLPNRAAYEKRLSELWEDATRSGYSVAAIMVDVDHFKSVNDTFGHLYGDRVLQRVATLLQQAVREEGDFVARFGGEEFVVLLPGSTLDSACYVAERIRTLVEVAGGPAGARSEGDPAKLAQWSTVSCGVAAAFPTDGEESRSLIDSADAALYVAKRAGRNRVSNSLGPRLIQMA